MSTSLRKFGKVCLMGLLIVLTTSAVLMAYVVLDSQGAIASTRHWLTQRPTQAHNRTPMNWTARPAVANLEPATEVQLAQEQFTGSDPFSSDSNGSPNPFAAAQPDVDVFGAEEDATSAEPEVRNFLADESSADEDFVESPQPAAAFGGGRGNFGGRGSGGRGRGRAAGDTPNFAGPNIHGLAVIGLVANQDGSLEELRWFTESLGAGEEAFTKLSERLTAFAANRSGTAYRMEARVLNGATTLVAVPYQVTRQNRAASRFDEDDDFAPDFQTSDFGAASEQPEAEFRASIDFGRGDAMTALMVGMPANPTHLAAQITASPEIRYAELKQVIEICQQHVEQIVFGDGESEDAPDVTLTLGFVRDGGGRKISSSPVLVWKHSVDGAFTVTDAPEDGVRTATPLQRDEIVTVQDLPQRLLNWRQTLSGDAQPDSLTALIRTDDGVDSKIVEQVVQAILPAGTERVAIQWLESQANRDDTPVFQDADERLNTESAPATESIVPDAIEGGVIKPLRDSESSFKPTPVEPVPTDEKQSNQT